MIDFWSFWGCVGSIFGRVGASWGSFGGLGGSWAALGRLLGGLEAVLDRSWAVLSRHRLLRVVLGPPACARKSHWGVQGGQDEPKIGPKTDQNRCQKRSRRKKALEDRLGAVLGRSWVVLSAVLGSKSCSPSSGARFFENRLFGENEGSGGDLGQSWVDLGRPRGVKMSAAEGQKRSYVEMILSC